MTLIRGNGARNRIVGESNGSNHLSSSYSSCCISDLSVELLSLRNYLKQNIEQQPQRAEIMRKVIQFCENKNYNLTQDELKSFIENMDLKV